MVISTRSKSGTTWMQQICVSMIHSSPELSAPLAELSPWVDWLVEPEDVVFARLEGQSGRRVVKTHTPLDGVVLDDRATYVVVVRDPLDLAVSLYHQGDNLNRERIAALSGRPVNVPPPRLDLEEWLAAWTRREVEPADSMDSLPGVVHHTADALARRAGGNVVLVRYEDLVADLEGCMRSLADRLGIVVAVDQWPGLVHGASFGAMSAAAASRAPDLQGVLRDPTAFFRRGRPGAGREVLGAADVAAYKVRLRSLAERFAAEPAQVDAVVSFLGGSR